MIIDKEYPATHSMSTAWYVADEEGNVAIIDYEDNGPVPWETEQTSIKDLVYGHWEDTEEFAAIDLTDDQIDDLMKNPHQPEEEKYWMDCIFQIDLEQETQFLELAKNSDIEIELCVSKKRGLYMVHCFSSSEKCGDKYKVKESSSLKKMIVRGMIKQIYDGKYFYCEDVEQIPFIPVPYFIYLQDYSGDFIERLNIPTNPVKLDQFPPALRRRVHRVPIKFRECKQFQIAEWVPSRFYSENEININGCIYQPIVLTNGTESYVYTSKSGLRFIDYCSERIKYNCKECSNSCFTVGVNEFSDRPTVMFVFHPYSHYDYNITVKSDIIIRNSVRIPLLYKVPNKFPDQFWVSEEDVMKVVTEDMLTDFFLKNHRYFEEMVLRFNPQVIIVEERAMSLLSKLYAFDEKSIKICDRLFPLYLKGDVENYRAEITKLSLLPYRGIEMPYIISKEEMEQFKKKYNVSD